MADAFWEYHKENLADPEYAREFAVESVRVRTIDTIIGQLDEKREEVGLSKAALARAVGSEPAVVRRLLSSAGMNPTLGTLAEIAAALGLKVALEPMSEAERHEITEPTLMGVA